MKTFFKRLRNWWLNELDVFDYVESVECQADYSVYGTKYVAKKIALIRKKKNY